MSKFDQTYRKIVGEEMSHSGDKYVYIIIDNTPYEGGNIYGIYSGGGRAQDALDHLLEQDPTLNNLEIKPVLLDRGPDYSYIDKSDQL